MPAQPGDRVGTMAKAKARGQTTSNPEDSGSELVSIGELAEATGIAPDTIRAWERRYGRPEAVRLPSGHRRYTSDDVRWLRRIAEALSLGHRPSKVVHLTEPELDDVLVPEPECQRVAETIRRRLRLLREYETSALREELTADARSMEPGAFLRDSVAPLMTSAGRSWADGTIGVRHEHLLTEVIQDLLRTMREQVAVPREGPLVLLATLEGEKHGLGLQMVALACAGAGVRALLLGPDVPSSEILDAVDETGADAVALSVSLSTGGIHTDRQLAALRRDLPERVNLVVGGAGARGVRRGPRGVEYIGSWDDLDRWLVKFGGADRA